MLRTYSAFLSTCLLSLWLMLIPANAQTEHWTDYGGRLNAGGGWFDWVQNDADGRYCAEVYAGHVECWDAVTNSVERVYTYNTAAVAENQAPRRGDLQTWIWDHVFKEYIHFDGCRSGIGVWAFHVETQTYRQLTDEDFVGLSTRSIVCGDGSAVSLDHDIAVIFGGRGSATGRQTRVLDLRARTYTEFDAPITMTPRSYGQQQFVYVPTLQKFLLFGGLKGKEKLNDLWLFDPATYAWTRVEHFNPPSPRYFGQMAYDISDNRVYLTGGHGGDGRILRLDLTTWTWEHLPLPDGVPLVDIPGYRRVGASVVDPLRGWCQVAGTLEGGNWIPARRIWCVQVEE